MYSGRSVGRGGSGAEAPNIVKFAIPGLLLRLDLAFDEVEFQFGVQSAGVGD